jgi:hypothetical protein
MDDRIKYCNIDPYDPYVHAVIDKTGDIVEEKVEGCFRRLWNKIKNKFNKKKIS